MKTRKLYLLSLSCFLFTLSYAQNNPCAFDQVQQQLMEQNPVYEAEVAHYTQEVLPRIAREQANARTVLTIPVVVHVIHSGQSIGSGANISMERIRSQIDILNEDYGRTNSDANQTPVEYASVAADTEIQFCLASVDPDGSVSNGVTRHVYSNIADIDEIENSIKPETSWDPNRYMNIWTIEIPSNTVIGYSYLPTPTIVGFPKDGIVIDYPNFGYIDAGNRGRTCVHEVGHYMGLQHTWGGSDSNGDPIGCSSDDQIADTPNCNGPHYGCPTFGQTSCGNVDMTMNYMEYVDDQCMNLFTNGQKNVMQATLNGIRSELANSALASCEQIDLSCQDLSIASLEMGFEPDELTNGWTVENANSDTRTWLITQNPTAEWGPNNGSGLAVYLWNSSTAADDYLFTPCFEVLDNHTYKISFSYACAEDNNGVYEEDFEVGFSETQNADDFTVLNNDWVFENVNNPYPDYNDKTLFFEPNSTKFTSLGFHVYSEADKYALQIDNIKVEDLGLNSSTKALSEKNLIQAAPNPTDGKLNLSLNFEKRQKLVDIDIFDVLGRVVLNRQINNIQEYQSTLDLSDFEEGIYFVRVKSADIMLTEKVLLSK